MYKTAFAAMTAAKIAYPDKECSCPSVAIRKGQVGQSSTIALSTAGAECVNLASNSNVNGRATPMQAATRTTILNRGSFTI